MADRLFRIAPGQSGGHMARQALMIAAKELRVITYREPYQMADPDQRDCLLHTLNTEFDQTIPLPPVEYDRSGEPRSSVFYLIVDLKTRIPILLPEGDVVPFVLALVFARQGIDAARRVTYRAEMLPAPTS